MMTSVCRNAAALLYVAEKAPSLLQVTLMNMLFSISMVIVMMVKNDDDGQAMQVCREALK